MLSQIIPAAGIYSGKDVVKGIKRVDYFLNNPFCNHFGTDPDFLVEVLGFELLAVLADPGEEGTGDGIEGDGKSSIMLK